MTRHNWIDIQLVPKQQLRTLNGMVTYSYIGGTARDSLTDAPVPTGYYQCGRCRVNGYVTSRVLTLSGLVPSWFGLKSMFLNRYMNLDSLQAWFRCQPDEYMDTVPPSILDCDTLVAMRELMR